MTDREEREECQFVIEVLQNMLYWMQAADYIVSKPERIKAVKYAIASIETDLKYDLLYEETSGQADKQADKPTTKNDVPDINVGKIDPTPKNNLGVDAVSRQAINGYIDYILSHGMGKKKSFDFIKKFVANLPSVTPLSSGLEKNSKKLEKDFGESDCISRADAIKALVQEPKTEWEHDHEILRAYADGANNVLDKIRAEILEYIDDLDIATEICNIFDKYKAESEK